MFTSRTKSIHVLRVICGANLKTKNKHITQSFGKKKEKPLVILLRGINVVQNKNKIRQ